MVAVVQLLIGHATWLRRKDFVDESWTPPTIWPGRPCGVGGLAAAVRVLDAGELPCSGSERQLLRIAASLAEGVLVDLGDAVAGLAEVNVGVVGAAVMHGNGGGDRRDGRPRRVGGAVTDAGGGEEAAPYPRSGARD